MRSDSLFSDSPIVFIVVFWSFVAIYKEDSRFGKIIEFERIWEIEVERIWIASVCLAPIYETILSSLSSGKYDVDKDIVCSIVF